MHSILGHGVLPPPWSLFQWTALLWMLSELFSHSGELVAEVVAWRRWTGWCWSIQPPPLRTPHGPPWGLCCPKSPRQAPSGLTRALPKQQNGKATWRGTTGHNISYMTVVCCPRAACAGGLLSGLLVSRILRPVLAVQELYSAVPVALAPVLGNPILLAAFGVDRTAPLQDQVPPPVLSLPWQLFSPWPLPRFSAWPLLPSDSTRGVTGWCSCWQAVAFGQGVAALLPQLSALTEILPAPTLAWKLKLLQEGNRCAAQPMLTSPLPPQESPPALTMRLTDTKDVCNTTLKVFTHSAAYDKGGA